MLLSGGLVGQQALTGRAVVVDAPLGKGHVVMFASRPFWRYQTHGSFNLAFNAILNWNQPGGGTVGRLWAQGSGLGSRLMAHGWSRCHACWP